MTTCLKVVLFHHADMSDISYEQWLNLRCQLMWCYDREQVAESRMPAQLREPPLAAWLVRRGWVSARSLHGGGAAWRQRAGPGQWLIVPPGPRQQAYHPDCAFCGM